MTTAETGSPAAPITRDLPPVVTPERETSTKKRRLPARRQPTNVPWFFVAPALLVFVVFYFLPTVLGAWYAFTNWDGFSAAEWVGMDNFQEIAGQRRARAALWHTLVLALLYIVAVNVLGLLLALGLSSTVKTAGLLRALFFFPAVVSPLAIAYIWRYILDLDGALNQILQGVGLDGLARPWLGEPRTALLSVAAVMVWQHTGWMMLIYLAGLQGIQRELYEAASIDGARPWRQFMDITRPLLLPAFTVCVVLSTILAFTVFDQVIGLTGGGPIGATDTIGTHIYKTAFQEGRFGYSAAVAVLLTAGVALVAILQMSVIRRRAKWQIDA